MYTDPLSDEFIQLTQVMNEFAASFYDAFTECAFGGSQAAVILDAASLDAGRRATMPRPR